MIGDFSDQGARDASRTPSAGRLPLSKHGKHVLAGLIAFLTALLVNACDRPPHGTTDGSTPTEKIMRLPTTELNARPMRPLIDRNVTAHLETATFALG